MGLKNKITIWQQNVNKSSICQYDVLSNNELAQHNTDIIAIQEPPMNAFNLSIASKDWIPVYPMTHGDMPEKTRSLTLVCANLSTDNWNQIDFPSGDVTVIQLKGKWGRLMILNIYNNGDNNDTIQLLTKFHRDHMLNRTEPDPKDEHTIWLRDFNRHHLHWDNPNNTRLFTREATAAAEVLIEAVAEAGLELVLPRGIPTHYHNVTKQWTRLDQVFLSEHSKNILISCEIQTKHRGIRTDHLPIMTELNLEANTIKEEPIQNFCDIDWEEFSKTLLQQLDNIQPATQILTQRQMDQSCDELTKAIQYTILREVPITEVTPKSKRWWTKELTQLWRQVNKLGRKSYRCRKRAGTCSPQGMRRGRQKV
jgi:exonuclease III